MMSPKDETTNMDEEKSFEVIQEDRPYTTNLEPHIVRRGLTEVSAMFDRHGKGYLDETERALRRMDSQNQGHLGVDKVCVIFESLQAEQERNSELLEALRVESKKSLNLKKGVIALTVFTILLACANVGTSFAVASLTKEMSASDNGELTSVSSGERLATTNKLVSFEMESLDETRRRRLQADSKFMCERMAETLPNGQTEKECSLQGVIKLAQANALHSQLESVDFVQLTCNNRRSNVYGGTRLSGTPGVINMGVDYRVFPDGNDTNEKYTAMQRVRVPAKPATSTSPARASFRCNAEFELAMYCPTQLINGQQQECLVMSASQPTGGCPQAPVVCGPKPTQPSFIN